MLHVHTCQTQAVNIGAALPCLMQGHAKTSLVLLVYPHAPYKLPVSRLDSGLEFVEYDLLTVEDDVLFGSRSVVGLKHHFCTSILHF